jgi:hypothetical protein
MANPVLRGGYGSPQSIRQASTDQHHRIGAEGFLNDGRKFRYCRYVESGAATRGLVLVKNDLAANHQNLATATAGVAAGRKTITDITLGATAVTANQYQYIMIVDGAGAGTFYAISGHPTADASATDFEVDLFDTIEVAGDADTEVTLIQSVYADVQLAGTDDADNVAGVPHVAIPAGNTTTQYAWLQTKGIGPCVTDGTPAVNQAMVVSGTTAGRIAAQDIVEGTGTLDIETRVAFMNTVGIDGEDQACIWDIPGG